MQQSTQATHLSTGFWSQLNTRTWNDILTEDWGDFSTPFTVHLPIHPAHTPDLIHVGPALEVARQRIVPGLDAHNFAELVEVLDRETLLVQFALGDPPVVPEFYRTRLSLEDGRYPIAHARHYMLNGMLFDFEYSCCALPDSTTEAPQSLLCIRGTVTNTKEEARQAHVRAKVNFPQGNQVFKYHYFPYYWDTSKYLPQSDIELRGGEILRKGETIGRILPNGFAAEWEEQAEFTDEQYARAYHNFYSSPHSSLRYTSVHHAIHLSQELQPQQSSTFELAFLTNYEAITPSHLQTLREANAGSCREKALAHFKELQSSNRTELIFPTQNWGDIFAHLPINSLQLIVRFPDMAGMMPTQGGTSERFFAWVGECGLMLLPLLKLGYFAPVREAVEFVFSLQDGGYPPRGRITTTEGSVGTTGPKWLNTTGGALAMASEYYSYSRDEGFLEEYLPRILRAMNWIVGEIGATRVLNEDGTRPTWYGLMPFGCGNDGDYGYVVATTDTFTYWGLEKATLLLERIGHEQAAHYRNELDAYRSDIATTLEGMAREDGYIERMIFTGDPEEIIYHPFDKICGVYSLAGGNAVDVRSPLFSRYVEFIEARQGDDLFFGRMDHDTDYMGVAEWTWQDIYLRRGEWKKAFAMTQLNLKYGMTKAHQVQERFRETDPAFTPWQPNGSGNGKILDMLIRSLYFTDDGSRDSSATLLAGVPFAWLRKNGTTALRNLRTPEGAISLEAVMLDAQRCAIVLEASTPSAMPRRIRFPEYFAVTVDGQLIGEEYTVPDDAKRIEFSLTERAETI
jgi:hypothetical protein